MLATITIHLHLPGCSSLKEKRGRIKPLMAHLHREFNLSVAEIGLQDEWREAVVGCVIIGNGSAYLKSVIHTVANWIESNWTEGDVIELKTEMII